MMVNDFDDEHTLDEEEAMEEPDDQRNELSNLEKVGYYNYCTRQYMITMYKKLIIFITNSGERHAIGGFTSDVRI